LLEEGAGQVLGIAGELGRIQAGFSQLLSLTQSATGRERELLPEHHR